jgi:magnesium chelatase family protein
MYGQISTVAFVGIEAKPVEVQVRISGGQHAFAIVGLPDKAVRRRAILTPIRG